MRHAGPTEPQRSATMRGQSHWRRGGIVTAATPLNQPLTTLAVDGTRRSAQGKRPDARGKTWGRGLATTGASSLSGAFLP